MNKNIRSLPQGESPMEKVAIIAIICWALVSIFSSKKKNKDKQQDQDNSKLHDEISDLKARVAALEKIITDDGYQLKKDIDRL